MDFIIFYPLSNVERLLARSLELFLPPTLATLPISLDPSPRLNVRTHLCVLHDIDILTIYMSDNMADNISDNMSVRLNVSDYVRNICHTDRGTT